MKSLATSMFAIVLASGAAVAQSTTPPVAPATSAAPAVDSATSAKFKAADKDNSGVLEGAEVAGYKANMNKIDTNKDGKISMAEFAGAVKSGDIK